jgi:hypothetical protein
MISTRQYNVPIPNSVTTASDVMMSVLMALINRNGNTRYAGSNSNSGGKITPESALTTNTECGGLNVQTCFSSL